MKNSSRFELVMARNFSRSSAGTSGSRPSSRTRSLKASQESSRLMKKRGSDSAGGAGTTLSGGGMEAASAAGAWVGLMMAPSMGPTSLHAHPVLDNWTQRVNV